MTVSTENRARIMRRQARATGIRVTQRGNVFELRSTTRHLLSGSLETCEAYVTERYKRRNPGPRPRVHPPAAWAQMIDDYLLTLAAAGRPETTRKLRRFQLIQMAREVGGKPDEITGEHLVEWLGRRTGWSQETRRGHRAAARGFFIWAYKSKRIPVHVADDLPKVRQPNAAARPTPDSAWNAALLAADKRTTLILRLAGEAGLRRAEIAQVHARDLIEGVDGAQLLVNGKGNKKRIVPLSGDVAALVRQGGAGHTPGASQTGWLFPNGFGDHLAPYYIGELAQRVLPDRWTLHTARHRFASRAYRGTRNLRAVQVLLGHSSIGTTERYCAVDDSEIRAAMMAAGTGSAVVGV